MATSTGRDVIVALMGDVAELKRNSLLSAQHLEQLVKLQRDTAKRTERIARGLGKLVDLIDDHEARLTALETGH